MAINTAPSFLVGKTGYFLGQDGYLLAMDSAHLLKGGEILGISEWLLSRLRPDGTPDTTLAGVGHLYLGDTEPGAHNAYADLIPLEDGTFLAVGSRLPPGKTAWNQEAIVVEKRLPDGSLDMSFSSGGRSFIDSDPARMERVANAARLGDGTILVAATSYQVKTSADANAWEPNTGRINLARFLPNGDPDTSFGTGGALVIGDTGIVVSKMVVQGDGKIVIAAASHTSGLGWKVYRFHPDGTPDLGFGNNGVIHEQWATGSTSIPGQSSMPSDLLIQPDGSIVVAGTAPSPSDTAITNVSGLAVIRYLPNGKRDTTFNGDGLYINSRLADQGTWQPGGSEWGSATGHRVFIDDMGRILVGVNIYKGTQTPEAQLGFVRLRADGNPDPGFGDNGLMTFSIDGMSLRLRDAAVASDGRIFVSGEHYPVNGGIVGHFHGWLRPDGSFDPAFGTPQHDVGNVVGAAGAHAVTRLAPHLTLHDQELDQSNYAGATLTLARWGGASSGDTFVGSGPLSLANGVAMLGDTGIGTAVNSGGRLSIVFNRFATPALVDQLLQSIAYIQGEVDTGDLTIEWEFNDGNTGRQGSGSAMSATFYTSVARDRSDVPYWINAMLDQAYAGQDAGMLRQDLNNMLGANHTFKVNLGAESGSSAITSVENAAVQRALAAVAGTIDLRFGSTGMPLDILKSKNLSTGDAAALSLNDFGSAVWFNPAADASSLEASVLHALGHVFGLAHDAPEASLDAGSAGTTLGELEIAALQYLYGPSTTARTGDDIHRLTTAGANFIWDGNGNDTISAEGIGQDVTLHLQPGFWDSIGGRGNDITAAGQVTVNFGSVIENAIGGSGNDHLYGNGAANRLSGGSGNDVLQGMDGSDTIDGGAGTDTAFFAGSHHGYAVKETSTGWSITDKAGAGGADQLTAVEHLQFADGYYSFDVDGNAGQVFRLYQAVFGRAPDRAGLGFWMAQMDNGTSLDGVAGNFMQAGEFSHFYGVNPSNTLLLINLYQNILHRTPDPAGFAWWKGLLDQGTVTQQMVLVAFSEGQENVARLTGVMQAGMEYLPFG